MSREELAEALKRFMILNDVTYKETAAKLNRSVTTVQAILAAKPVSKRTLGKAQLVLFASVKT